MIEIDQKRLILIKKDQNRLTIIEIRSKYDQNCDCRFELVIGFTIGPNR